MSSKASFDIDKITQKDADEAELSRAKELIRANKKQVYTRRIDSRTVVMTTRKENLEQYQNQNTVNHGTQRSNG